MITGAVKMFNDEKGFGFIKRDDGGSDVFVHVKELRKCSIVGPVSKGDRFEFEIDQGDRGPRAINIKAMA
jgi:CspA family cold shock protein